MSFADIPNMTLCVLCGSSYCSLLMGYLVSINNAQFLPRRVGVNCYACFENSHQNPGGKLFTNKISSCGAAISL